MLNLAVLRWGQPYTSMDVDDVVHFATGEPIARVSRANGGMIQRDARKAQRARDVLREFSIDDLITMAGKAGELYVNAELPMGDGTQTPDRVRPRPVGDDRPARAHVPRQHEEECVRAGRDAPHPDLADARARLRRALSRVSEKSATCRSATRRRRRSSVSCCRRTRLVSTRLWLPVIPLQIGLMLKPGPQEPWTPYRMAEAFFQAGVPREAISRLPGSRRRRRGRARQPAAAT